MVEELPGKTRFCPQLKTLRVDDELVVSRGQRVGEPSGVLTVLTPANDSSTVALAQLESAYSLGNELDASWAARPTGLVHARERVPLVMEDPGGALLDGVVGAPPDVEEFLRLAIGLAFALGVLHKRGLIHKRTKPANILADLATRQVWLNGFGFCSRTPRESQAPNSPEAIAGTLVYMTSEHGDRMNPSVNSRADLYSWQRDTLRGADGTVRAPALRWLPTRFRRE
jgi:serine/threonine protein kinase